MVFIDRVKEGLEVNNQLVFFLLWLSRLIKLFRKEIKQNLRRIYSLEKLMKFLGIP